MLSVIPSEIPIVGCEFTTYVLLLMFKSHQATDPALIVVLEAKFGTQERQLLCVANTHVNVSYELKDVKLSQVHTFLKGLGKIAVSADIPMLVCGDFNTVPVDPLGIWLPHTKLTHQLPLVNAYSSFARMGGSLTAEQQRRRMDPASNEPSFTNCTRDFISTLDYIFHTANTLTVESLLELLDEESLKKDTALPSPEWSSDHVALLDEFLCMPKIRR